MGRRAVAVAEPGAHVAWRVGARGAARVEQTGGEVFYRVERGGPFVVETPAGQVSVLGTCFRVEVRPMRQALVGAAVGAVAATAIVTVYEGRVAVKSAHGETALAAGEKASLRVGDAPRNDAPPATATREELLTRDEAQRTRIAALETELRDAQRARAKAGVAGGKSRADEPESKSFGYTPDDLRELAKTCTIRFDEPFYHGQARQLDPKRAGKAGLTEDERARYNQVLTKLRDEYVVQVRALYREATGERGDNLDTAAIEEEIRAKSSHDDGLNKQLAEERAGLATPRDTNLQTPGERLVRLQMASGDLLEQAAASEIGAAKARAVRELGGSVSQHSGCPDRE
jgi:hypothetical protein